MKYVIIGENGEYSDRYVWVAGVYDSKEEAQRLVIEKSDEAREQARAYQDYDSFALVEVPENTWGRYSFEAYISPKAIEEARRQLDEAEKRREDNRISEVERTKQRLDRLAGKSHDWDDPKMQAFLKEYMG